MTPDREKQVLASLYDRLHDAITYTPDGKTSAFGPATTYIQMAKNVVLNPDDFTNMMSPGNPGGDLTHAELFSALVNAQPNTDALWSDSGKLLSETYSLIVNGANTDSKISEDQRKIYDQAYSFLNVATKTKDYTGAEKTQMNPSPISISYDDNFAAYITAVGGYRTAYNGYDLSKVEDQRAFNAVQPGLQLAVDQAYNKWNREGRTEVEQAQAALAATINDAIRTTIEQAQGLVTAQHQMAPNTVGGVPWLPSYALPTNWYSDLSKASQLKFSSSYLNEESSTEATSYAAEASGSWGLWHASGGVSGSSQKETAHMDAEDLQLEAELIFVQIKRPWFNPLLFSMNNWWVSGFNKGQISNGEAQGPADRAMPLVPTGFVVARNVTITADFSEEDKSFVSNSISTKASGGWGPFSVSGSYSHSSSKSEYAAKFDGGSLKLPGLQLVAWINSITPRSAPMDPK